MSTATLAPPLAQGAPILATRAPDPEARESRRLAAEQKLADLERAVERLKQRLFAPTAPPRRSVPRRSRRSAWLPSQ